MRQLLDFIHNKRKNKQGSMLILVLIIMVVGLILFTSAMMITTETRTRYYQNAKANQARLTVTSVAEAFYQAVYLQEITDEQLEALAAADAQITFNISGSSVAGAAATSNNTTTAKFDSGVVGGSETIIIYFSTTIDSQEENVKMTLTSPDDTDDPNLFQNCVDAGEGADLGQCLIGAGAPDGATDNFVVLRGNSDLAGSGTGRMDSVVVCTGIITGNSGNIYHNDVVFYGSDAGYNIGSGGNGITIAAGEGDCYFVSPDGELGYVFRNSDGSPNTAVSNNYFNFNVDNLVLRNTVYNGYGQNMYNIINGRILSDGGSLNNTVLQYGDMNPGYGNDAGQNWGASSPYNNFVLERNAASSAYVGGNSLMQELANQANEYLNGDLKSSIDAGFPTSAQARTQFGVPSSAPSGSTVITGGQLANGATLTAGNYIINGGSLGASGWSNKDATITCDLATGNYTFYVNGNFSINSGHFEVINGANSDNWVRFILADGVDMNIGQPANMYGNRTTGIISTGTHTGRTQATSGKPHVYIFGASGNTVTMYQYAVVDAYIGVFGSSDNGTEGTVLFNNGPYFYGRITATTIRYVGGTPASIPYCPDPTAEEFTGNIAIRYSEYNVIAFDYYY